MKNITHFAKVSILYLKTDILPNTNISSFYCLCHSLGYFLRLWNILSLTPAPRILIRFSKIIFGCGCLAEKQQGLMPQLGGNMTANSHDALVTTLSRITGMSRSCAQSLIMRSSGTLLGALIHHIVTNVSKVLLQKPGRSICLTCWYGLYSRDLHIRYGDSYLRGYSISNTL